MKSFLKFTLASILGMLISLFIVFLIFAGIIGAASSDKPPIIKAHSILLAKFDVPVVDRDSESPFDALSFRGFDMEGKLGLNRIIENIEKAATDENIDGIFLDLTVIPAGVATLEEIRSALLKFKESKKFIYAHADFYTQGSYYLATVADKIFLNPEGEITWKGLSSQQIFFKRALDKLGIDPQVIRHGSYKSAAEPFILEKLSDENRRQITDYVTSIWEHFLNNISDSRNIPVAELQKYADDLIISNARSAYEKNLVDSLLYFDEVLTELKKLTSTSEKDNISAITMKKYIKVPKKRETKGLIRDKIAVIYASGNIVFGEGESNMMGSDKIARVIREARRDSSIKAIVLRVNSGGGSALASEVIWREVKLASQAKPLIASLGDVAASGGYYIIAPAKKIIANKNTITGSIGVIGLIPNAKTFMKDKLGITSDVVKTNKHSDLGTFLRPLEPEELKMFEREIGNTYNTFTSHVAEGRGMTREAVDKIGGGRVYSGVDAKEIGLIDEFGGLKDAIKLAAKEAGLEIYRTVEMPKKEDTFEAILKQLSGEVKFRIIRSELGENYRYYEQLKKIQQLQGIQAIMPFEINVN